MKWLSCIVLLLAIITFSHTFVTAQENDAETWLQKGIDLLDQEQNEDALAAFNESITLDPENDKAWMGIAWACNDLDRYEQALEASNAAIELNPENDVAWKLKARALFAIEQYDDALVAIQKAIELNQKDSMYFLQKGLILDAQGEYKKALEAYDQAIELNPESAYAWTMKGVTYFHDSQLQNSLDAYNTALTFEPDNENITGMRDIVQDLVGIKNDEIIENNDMAFNNKSKTPINTLQSSQIAPAQTTVTKSPVYSGSECDCSGDYYNCDDFPFENGLTAQDCYKYCMAQGKGDVHDLDHDGDGHFCEN